MIIELLLDLVFNVVSLLLVFEIPSMPAEVMSYVETSFDYMVGAVGIVANYFPLPYVLTLFGVVLAIDGGILIYHFVMWIIRKIPMLGIK